MLKMGFLGRHFGNVSGLGPKILKMGLVGSILAMFPAWARNDSFLSYPPTVS